MNLHPTLAGSGLFFASLALFLASGSPVHAQTKASITYFGSACRVDTGLLSTKCAVRNEVGTFANTDLFNNMRYYLSHKPGTTMSISGFALNTKTVSVKKLEVPAMLVAADPVTGAPDPSKILSRGRFVVGQKQDWYLAWLCPAVEVKANTQVYLAFDVPKDEIWGSTVTTGNKVTHYRQALPSGVVVGPEKWWNWRFRVRCGGECPGLAALTPPRYGNSQEFVIEVQNASPLAFAITFFGNSNTTWNGYTLPLDLSVLVGANTGSNCQLQVQMAFGNGHGISPTGKSRITIPIKEKALIGERFYVQTLTYDFMTSRIVNTQGMEAVIGF
jgi:hypothetical protein